MATITAPIPHSEFMCGVQFTNGVAESSQPSTLAYFKARGYKVTDKPAAAPVAPVVLDKDDAPVAQDSQARLDAATKKTHSK